MTTSRFPDITDELLSAYIDNAVSESERVLVEAALREDSTVAWRLATLRETVQLLRSLPVIQAPRSFVLTPEQVGQPIREPAYAPNVISNPTTAGGRTLQPAHPVEDARSGRWADVVERWRRFWQAGSPVWRNAMATSMAILLVLVILPAFLSDGAQQAQLAAPQAISEESAPVAFDAAPAAPTQRDAAEAAPEAADLAQLEAPAAASEGDVQAPQPTAVPDNALDMPAQEVTAAEAPVQPQADLQTMEAARVAPPTGRSDDPFNIPSEAQEPAMPGDDALAGIAASSPVGGAELAAPAPMLGMEDTASTALEMAPAGEPAVAAASLVEEEPETLTSTAVMQETEERATDDVESAPAVAPSVSPSAAPIQAREAVADEPVTQAPAVAALATPSEADAQKRPAAPASNGAALAIVAESSSVVQILAWLQITLAAAALLFGLLWWRSRS